MFSSFTLCHFCICVNLFSLASTCSSSSCEFCKFFVRCLMQQTKSLFCTRLPVFSCFPCHSLFRWRFSSAIGSSSWISSFVQGVLVPVIKCSFLKFFFLKSFSYCCERSSSCVVLQLPAQTSSINRHVFRLLIKRSLIFLCGWAFGLCVALSSSSCSRFLLFLGFLERSCPLSLFPRSFD